MNFTRLTPIQDLEDDFGDPYFNEEEVKALKEARIYVVFQLFQDFRERHDHEAKYALKELSHIKKGGNSREYRIETLLANSDGDIRAQTYSTPHMETISYNKMPHTFSPSADGYLPRRIRGELAKSATTIFDGTRETREAFDNHHRGGGYDCDDYRKWSFD